WQHLRERKTVHGQMQDGETFALLPFYERAERLLVGYGERRSGGATAPCLADARHAGFQSRVVLAAIGYGARAERPCDQGDVGGDALVPGEPVAEPEDLYF